MSNERLEFLFHGLLRHALVPPSFRATNEADEDAALEALGDVPVSPTQYDRMLKKILGEEPCFSADTESGNEETPEPASLNADLAAMFRLGDGEAISDELEEHLRELEKEAMDFDSDSEDEIDIDGEDNGG